MKKIGLLLFFALNYFTSTCAFTHSRLLQTKSTILKTNMCSNNLNSISTRRNILKIATLPVISLLPSIVNAQDVNDVWTRHNGKFTEEEIKDFSKTDSGLLYKDIKQGKGALPKDGDAVTVEMVGYIFETGEKWCNTYKGIPAYQSVVRAGARENQKFMKGLNEGVKSMQVGGKRIMVLPAYLAYNYVTIYSQENPEEVIVPGGSALVLYVEMLSFKQLNN